MECFVVPSTLITRSCVTCVTLNHNTHCKNHSSCTHKTCTLWIYMHDLNTIQSVRTQLTTTTLALTQRVWHMIHTQRDQIWTGTAILSVSAGQGQKMSDGSGDSHSQSWQWESITFGCNVDLCRSMTLKKVWLSAVMVLHTAVKPTSYHHACTVFKGWHCHCCPPRPPLCYNFKKISIN